MFTLIRPKIWGGPGLPGLLGDYIPVEHIISDLDVKKLLIDLLLASSSMCRTALNFVVSKLR